MRAVKGAIAITALGLVLLVFSVVAITIPRPMLLHTPDVAEHRIAALIILDSSRATTPNRFVSDTRSADGMV